MRGRSAAVSVYKGGKRKPQHRKEGCAVAAPMVLLMLPWAMVKLARDNRRERKLADVPAQG